MDFGDTFDKYMESLEDAELSPRTIENNKVAVDRFLKWLGNNKIDELTLDATNKYLRELKRGGLADTTMYHHRAILKKFLASVDPVAAKEIKLKNKKREPPIILSQPEIEQLIAACMNNRDRAFISFMYESGCRLGEILSIRIENLTFNSYGVLVTIPKGKTGSRTIQVVYSASYLRQWVAVHPNKEIVSSFLFCSLKPGHGLLSDTGVKHLFDALRERTGIKKRIYPHLLRHSRASHLANQFTEQQLKAYLGWTQSSKMPAVYVQLSQRDMQDAVLKLHGIATQDNDAGLKVVTCPRCKEIQPESLQFCGKCGMVLDSTLAAKEADEMQAMKSEIEKMKAGYDEINKLYHKIWNTKEGYELGVNVIKKIHPNRLILQPKPENEDEE